MNKQTLRECILDGLLEMGNIKDEDLDFAASFLAGWLLSSIRYETVDLELDKKENKKEGKI